MKRIITIVTILLMSAGSPGLLAQILYSETFVSSLNTATASGGSNGNWIFTNSCSMSTAAGHSAPGSALFSGSGCQFGNGGSTVSGNLTTPPIPIGSSGAVLTFNYLNVTECGTNGISCFYDNLTLQISNNGGATWTNIMSSSGTPAGLYHQSGWTAVSYTLNSYSNQTILIRFNYNSVDGIGNAYDGVYVDDIVVTGNCFVNLTTLPGNGTVSPLICAGTNVTLTTNAVSNITWSPGGANTQSIVVAPGSNTNYSVTGTSTANCTSGASMAVVVNPTVPVLSIVNTASANAGTCPNSTVMLTASGANTYTWSGGPVSVTNGVAFAPTTTGTYVISGANACGITTAAVSISVHPSPTLTAVASQASLCSGNSVIITGIGNPVSWSVNGTPGNGISVMPSVTMNHTVVGTSALGCTAQAVVPVTVVTTPIAPPVSIPPLICIGSTATLQSTGATGYTWIATSGVISSNSSLTVSPTSSTTYTLSKSNSNCVNTQTVMVTVNNLPSIFAIIAPTVTCAGQTATLQAAGASTYTWTSGPPAFSVTGSAPVVSPVANTTYSLAASDGTCQNTTVISLSVNPNPTISVAPTATVICRDQSVTLTASGGINYTWTTVGIASPTNNAAITESPQISTMYEVTGDNSFGCTSVGQQVVIVNNTPTLNVSSNKPLVCSLAPANLTVTGANTYQWDANANNATTPVVTVNPPVTTIYTVTGTFVSTQCSSSKTIQVAVFLPTFAVNSPTSSCLGGNINLIASGALSYTWNGNQPFAQINVSPPTATVYMVSATSVSAGVQCVSSNSVQVSIYSNPTITAVPERTQICRNETTNLLASGGETYIWNTTQTGSAVPVNPLQNTTYTVTGTDQNGCVGVGTVLLRVSSCIGIEDNSLFAGMLIYPNPNAGSFNLSSDVPLSLILYSELGQVLRIINLESGGVPATVSDLSPGIYFLHAESGSEKQIHKIVVTR